MGVRFRGAAVMRIMISAEGVTDAGWEDWTGSTFETMPGPIQVYITRILRETGALGDGTIDFVKYDRKAEKRRRKANDHFTHFGKAVIGAKGHGQEAAIMCAAARQSGCDAAVFHVDSDRPEGNAKDRRTCEKHFSKMCNEVMTGCGENKEACPLIPCVPVKMTESWLLADENAIIAVSDQPDQDSKRLVPSSPELIWGDKDDLESNYPKNALKRVLGEYRIGYNRAAVSDIAQNQNLKLVCERCDISFGSFFEAIKMLGEGNEPA